MIEYSKYYMALAGDTKFLSLGNFISLVLPQKLISFKLGKIIIVCTVCVLAKSKIQI